MTAAPTAPSLLDSVDILRALSPTLKAQLQSQLEPVRIPKDQPVFQQGMPGDSMYFIVRGTVGVYVTDAGLGITTDLARLGPGSHFGEMALVTGEGRSASVKAIEECDLLKLKREIFYRLVQTVPQVGLAMASALAKRLEKRNAVQGIPFVSLKGKDIPHDVLELLPDQLITQHRVLPIEHSDGVITLGAVDPENRLGIEDVRAVLRGSTVKVVAISANDFEKCVQRELVSKKIGAHAAPSPQALAKMARQVKFITSQSEADEVRLQQVSSGEEIVNLVNSIAAEAIERGASDIHVEPERDRVQVRYRIDGRLMTRDGLIQKSAHMPLVSRLKVLAGLDISERRMPQDGRIAFLYGKKNYDLRMATVATKYGEKVTCRVLDSSVLDTDLGTLIASEKVSTIIRQLFYRSTGLILVTGPTGSGKTTTLYSALRERLTPELAVCTIEDPIEYNIDGLVQVQVNEGIGLGFPEVMRTFMRLDPDIIFVGETRDTATAKLACTAALTGHLVLTSFHTNDAPSSVIRLRSMGVEDFVLSDALLGVLNQRLVRRVCPTCKEAANMGQLVRENLKTAGVILADDAPLYRGKGCDRCGGSGYVGRVGVYELLLASPAVKAAIAAGGGQEDIKRAAADGAYVPLSAFATHLLQEGMTVPSEVLRILPRV